MTAKDDIDWSLTTWKGSRRQQHQELLAFTFRQKLESVEEMCDLALRFLEYRKKNGLPYIDPYTDQLVRPDHESPPDAP